jgi:hypothetical protein
VYEAFLTAYKAVTPASLLVHEALRLKLLVYEALSY